MEEAGRIGTTWNKANRTNGHAESSESECASSESAGNGDVLCQDAFRIILNDYEGSEKQWFSSTMSLQVASLQLCVACRSARFYHVRIATLSPWLNCNRDRWEEQESLREANAALTEEMGVTEVRENYPRYISRVPRLRLRRMTWELSTAGSNRHFAKKDLSRLLIIGDDLHDDVREAMFPPSLQSRSFPRDFNATIRMLSGRSNIPPPTATASTRSSTRSKIGVGVGVGVGVGGGRFSPWASSSLSSLRELFFGSYFNEDFDEKIVLPSSLTTLVLGSGFNRSISRIKWPPAIRHIVLGWRFNQDVRCVSWPISLKTLEFGFSFDQSIAGTRWPPSLQSLTFGDMFSQNIGDGVGGWPASLQKLAFGYSFDIVVTTWPKNLRSLSLGNGFDQPIDGVEWPDSLRELELGQRFNRPIYGVAWPASLRRLTFGTEGSFDQAIDRVNFPESMEVLEFGWKFNQPITRVRWPPSLRQLRFGWAFNQAVQGVHWPNSLQTLTFGQNFNQPVVGERNNNRVAWPASLRRLEFGGEFQQPLEGIVLPPALVELVLGYQFNHPIDRVAWPASLRQLTLGGRFNHPLRELPPGLTELILRLDRDNCDRSLTGVRWPTGLTKLTLPVWIDIDGVVLPEGAKVKVVRYRYHE